MTNARLKSGAWVSLAILFLKVSALEACLDDTYTCPDGTVLSRNDENCEFPVCPGCQEDLHLCDDGTSVQRDPNKNCTFPPCPVYEPVFCTQDAKQCPDGTFVGRDSSNNCEFFPCESEGGKGPVFKCSKNKNYNKCNKDSALGCTWLVKSGKCVDRDETRCADIKVSQDCTNYLRQEVPCSWNTDKEVCEPASDRTTTEKPLDLLDCSVIKCDVPSCGKNSQLVTPSLSCCPQCVECYKIECGVVECDSHLVKYLPDDECCEKCGVNCQLVRCAEPICGSGQQVAPPPPGQCCSTCRDCAEIKCLDLVCPEGEVHVNNPDGSCCPVCGTPGPGELEEFSAEEIKIPFSQNEGEIKCGNVVCGKHQICCASECSLCATKKDCMFREKEGKACFIGNVLDFEVS